MNTEARTPEPLHAITHPVPGMEKVLSLICLVISLSGFPFSHAIARETSPFANHLAAPPPFNPEMEKADPEPGFPPAGNQQLQASVRATGKARAAKRTPEKARHDLNPDINTLPPPGAGSRKFSQGIASLKKNDMIENEWKMGFELRSSPVLENHGNEERHSSIGGLIKGSLKF